MRLQKPWVWGSSLAGTVQHFNLQLGVQIIEICLANRDRNGGEFWCLVAHVLYSDVLYTCRLNEFWWASEENPSHKWEDEARCQRVSHSLDNSYRKKSPQQMEINFQCFINLSLQRRHGSCNQEATYPWRRVCCDSGWRQEVGPVCARGTQHGPHCSATESRSVYHHYSQKLLIQSPPLPLVFIEILLCINWKATPPF